MRDDPWTTSVLPDNRASACLIQIRGSAAVGLDLQPEKSLRTMNICLAQAEFPSKTEESDKMKPRQFTG
jgi:hypothetical protein